MALKKKIRWPVLKMITKYLFSFNILTESNDSSADCGILLAGVFLRQPKIYAILMRERALLAATKPSIKKLHAMEKAQKRDFQKKSDRISELHQNSKLLRYLTCKKGRKKNYLNRGLAYQE